MSVRIDFIDLEICKQRGIWVLDCANANTNSVAKHEVGLYLAARRKVVELPQRTIRGEWADQGALLGILRDHNDRRPLSLKDEKVGIVGYGSIGMAHQPRGDTYNKLTIASELGRQIVDICTSLRMSVCL
ncbi:hypothetical protein A1O1_03285 [Capronia coronata CBS 617.96]|uniref:D-isomer specific 2-hydroxyacid dehydrogenase catalytic domain-containing protein n=1 Tax=Capronia coronata CBS 617.96 TaxID=1182541 RepID=W9YLR3_9EURO|nr:uncharacterized protein A1O1_03285 [Capronia coronata CBS 617.96]EXJ90186.1 hypothetical protein A1O1_03285 [Capronia coronata CBS 617.96]